jgi:hypothetical protein
MEGRGRWQGLADHTTDQDWFKVENGLITEIEGIFSVSNSPGEGSGWPAASA